MTDGRAKTDLLHAELSYQVMRAVFEVHNHLGPGFAEGIYEEALVREFERCGIPYQRQKIVEVHYKGAVVGVHRLDLVVDDRIVLELKAATGLDSAHLGQVLSYLRASGLQLGILINFGTPRVQSRRVVNTGKRIRGIR